MKRPYAKGHERRQLPSVTQDYIGSGRKAATPCLEKALLFISCLCLTKQRLLARAYADVYNQVSDLAPNYVGAGRYSLTDAFEPGKHCRFNRPNSFGNLFLRKENITVPVVCTYASGKDRTSPVRHPFFSTSRCRHAFVRVAPLLGSHAGYSNLAPLLVRSNGIHEMSNCQSTLSASTTSANPGGLYENSVVLELCIPFFVQ